MKPWSLSLSKPQLETIGGDPVLTVGWRRQSSEGDLHHLYAYRFTDPFDVTSTAPIYSRLFGHLILDEIPDLALPEVLELLANAWIFHQPGPPQIEAPKVRSIRGKVTKRYERPAYSLVEEE